jgi:hypothetical protein
MTAKAIVAPTTNHQRNTLIDDTEASHLRISVKRAVLDRFRNVHGLDPFRICQIGDRTGNP